MSIWAVGDIQGCGRSFAALRERIAFRPGRDRLLLVGDLVNRGPDSLGVLRWVVAHDPDVTAVLGNHDLHLLGVAAGVVETGAGDTLDAVLSAPDRDDLLAWLRRQPLARDLTLLGRPHLLVHAGLPPGWSPADAVARGDDLAGALAGPDGDALLAGLRADVPLRWSDALDARARRAHTAAALTRMRMVTDDGALDLDHKGPPDAAPPGLRPWCDAVPLDADGRRVLCGHWAALGVLVRDDLAHLDGGCVWGGELAALELGTGVLVRQPCVDAVRPRD